MRMILRNWEITLAAEEPLDFRRTQRQLSPLLTPGLTYLSQVDNWGLYELELFRLYALGLETDLLWRFTQQSVKKSKKLATIAGNDTVHFKCLATAFSVFLALEEFSYAKNVLKLWQQQLTAHPNVEFALNLPFYQGWLLDAQGHSAEAQILYQQTITLYEQIHQKKTAHGFRRLQKTIQDTVKKHHYLIFIYK